MALVPHMLLVLVLLLVDHPAARVGKISDTMVAAGTPPPTVSCDPHAQPVEYCPDGSACPQCGKPACECSPNGPKGPTGVTLSLWNSSAGVLDPQETPSSRKVIPTLNFSVSTGGKPFSAEVRMRLFFQ